MPHAIFVEKMMVKLVSAQTGSTAQVGQLKQAVLRAPNIQEFGEGFGKAVNIANDQQVLHKFGRAALRDHRG